MSGVQRKLCMLGHSMTELLTLHAYSLMAVGIAVLRMLQVDSKITKARYRQKWSEK